MENKLAKTLGLKDGMSTYFLKAPSEYFALIGKKPQPYDDIFGEYDFVHAFFTDIETLTNFAELLLAKVAADGILWVSWPLNNDAMTEQKVDKVFNDERWVGANSCRIGDSWVARRYRPSGS